MHNEIFISELREQELDNNESISNYGGEKMVAKENLRLTITLRKDIYQAFNEAAEYLGLTKTELISELLKKFLFEEGFNDKDKF